MDRDGDVEIVYEGSIMPSSLAQKELLVLKALQQSKKSIPINYQQFSEFTHSFLELPLDDEVIHKVWSRLMHFEEISSNPVETIEINSDEDTEIQTLDSSDSAANIFTNSAVKRHKSAMLQISKISDSLEETISPLCVDTACGCVEHVLKPEIPKHEVDQNQSNLLNDDIMTLIKQQVPPGFITGPSSDNDSTGNCQLLSAIEDKILVKKLEQLGKLTSTKIESSSKPHRVEENLKKNKKRKALSKGFCNSDGVKKKKKKRCDKPYKTEEEECNELRMSLFIDKLIEMALPSILKQQRRHSI